MTTSEAPGFEGVTPDQAPRTHQNIHQYEKTKRWGAWTRCSGSKRHFLGAFLTESLALRAQDRANLKLKNNRTALNFPASDYDDDEYLRETLSPQDFMEHLRKESRSSYKRAIPSLCLKKFMAEEGLKFGQVSIAETSTEPTTPAAISVKSQQHVESINYPVILGEASQSKEKGVIEPLLLQSGNSREKDKQEDYIMCGCNFNRSLPPKKRLIKRDFVICRALPPKKSWFLKNDCVHLKHSIQNRQGNVGHELGPDEIGDTSTSGAIAETVIQAGPLSCEIQPLPPLSNNDAHSKVNRPVQSEISREKDMRNAFETTGQNTVKEHHPVPQDPAKSHMKRKAIPSEMADSLDVVFTVRGKRSIRTPVGVVCGYCGKLKDPTATSDCLCNDISKRERESVSE